MSGANLTGGSASALVFEAAATVIVALLGFAACTDVATRMIPDSVSVALAVIGLATRAIAGTNALVVSVAAAAVMFLLLLPLHARGLFGGGDVKLISATCLGLSLASISHFLYVTVIAGGALALIYLAARRALRDLPFMAPPPPGTALPRRVLRAECWRIARHGPLPYGVAIAFGGIWTVVSAAGVTAAGN